MNNESGSEAFRRFQENPKDTLIFYADDLYRQIPGLRLRGALWGGVWGLLLVTIMYLIFVAAEGAGGRSVSSIEEFVAALAASKPSLFPWLMGAGSGGVWGLNRGERRAQRLRGLALVNLALADIEAKLNKLEEASKPPEIDTPSSSQNAI